MSFKDAAARMDAVDLSTAEQLTLPEAAFDPSPRIGVKLSRKEWLDFVEVETKSHRARMEARFRFKAALSLTQPGNDFIDEPHRPNGKVNRAFFRKFDKMRAEAIKSGNPVALQAANTLEMNAVARAVVTEVDPRLYEIASELTGEPACMPPSIDTRGMHKRPLYGAPRWESLASTNAVQFAKELEGALPSIDKHPTRKHAHGSVVGYHWNTSREVGQRERFDRVRQCGGQAMLQSCKPCKKKGPKITLTCDQHRLCYSCRKRRVEKFRKRFSAARTHVLQEGWRLRLSAPTRIENGYPVRGGRWTEKLFTFTLPHSGDVAADTKELPATWRRFQRFLFDHIVKDILGTHDKAQAKQKRSEAKLLSKMMKFVRVLEVTPGIDGLGHAHLHVWFFGPFIDQSRLSHMWGMALPKLYKDLLMFGANANRDLTRDDHSRPDQKDLGLEDVPVDCPCGRVHERAVGQQSVERALQLLDCRLQGSGMAESTRATIVARERAWYCNYRLDPLAVKKLITQLSSTLVEKISAAELKVLCQQEQSWYDARSLGTALQGTFTEEAADLRERLTALGIDKATVKSLITKKRAWYSHLQRRKQIVNLWRPVVDVRECYGTDIDVTSELCKYLIKDGQKHEGTLELVDPRLFARIYAALEGRRAIAGSIGLLTPLPSAGCFCRDCGCVYTRKIVDIATSHEKTGPPQLELGLQA